MLVGTFMVTMTTVSFYMITAYTPTFGNSVLHLASIDSLIVTLCVGASNLFWLPIMGALSDRIGRRPLLFGCTLLMLITAYPAMLWLVREPSFAQVVGGRTVAILYLWQLQRGHGGDAYGNHAGGREDVGICSGLQPGYGDFWRVHTGVKHVPDSYFRQSRHSRLVVVFRGSVRISRYDFRQASIRASGCSTDTGAAILNQHLN